MARSDVAQALNRLQGMAEKFISATTNRSIQLNREKEARVSEAYRYMVGDEERQITQLEGALDLMESNLLARGVELKSVDAEYRTIDSEELLNAANQSASSMLQVQLQDSQDYKERLENRKREADKVLRHINLLDDYMQDVDPKATGDPHLVDAEDVAKAAESFTKKYVEFEEDTKDRLEFLKTETELQRLQEDYYAKKARESQEKLTAAEADFATADIRRGRFEIIKKEALEGVRAKAYPVVGGLIDSFRGPINLGKEILAGEDALTGKSLTTSDSKEKEAQRDQEYKRLGVTLYPWASTVDGAAKAAKTLQSAFIEAGSGNYQDIINYLKTGYSKYILWMQESDNIMAGATTEEQKKEAANIRSRAENYKADVERMLGIEIDDVEWLKNLEELWNASLRADIDQGEEQVKMSLDMFSDPLIDESDYEVLKEDSDLEYYGW